MKLINLWQTSEERKAKYWLARSCRANHHHARAMRDWRLSKIERFFNLCETYNKHTQEYERDMTPYSSRRSIYDLQAVSL